jgi:hypothetical protein
MAALVWVMVGLALWHFTVFLPDRFFGGIVGAFIGACIGAFIFGFLISGFTVPGQDDMSLFTAVESIPGALAGIGLMYFAGTRQERLDNEARGGLTPRH